MLDERDTLPAPFVVQPSGRWDGDDGKWSSFAIQIGTPPQSVRVLPSTSSSQITVPVEEGCVGTLSSLSNCGNLRGIDSPDKNGFLRLISSSWSFIGIYDLFPQQDLIRDNGLFGRDTVQLGRSATEANNATIKSQLVAGVAQIPFWLGSIGLGSSALNISSIQAPSLLSNLKNQSIIPSLSYGYTAGQYYNNRPGSLVLGGFDQSKQTTEVVSSQIDKTLHPPRIQLQVQGIVAKNATGGSTTGFINSQFTASIDTSVNQMWLPSSVCDRFVDAFGLSEDKERGYFLLNDTMHAALKRSNPSFTFTVGGGNAGALTNIVLGYDALDMEIGVPVYNTSQHYFPIRRAANDSQVTFGRTFLQEAYMVVDWERGNFTIGPVASNTQSRIVAIQTPSTATSTASSTGTTTPDSSPPSGLGAGPVAGIAVSVAILFAAAFGLFFILRRKKQRRQMVQLRQSLESQPPEYDPTGGTYYDHKHHSVGQKEPHTEISELFDSSLPRAELTSDNVRKLEELVEQRELMSTPILELEGDRADSELDGSTKAADRTSGTSGMLSPFRQSVASPPPERVMSPLSNQSIYEME